MSQCRLHSHRVTDGYVLQASTDEETPLPTYEPEDKVIAKVATLYGTLEQLGFTKERIEECLRAVKVLELDEVLDWVSSTSTCPLIARR